MSMPPAVLPEASWARRGGVPLFLRSFGGALGTAWLALLLLLSLTVDLWQPYGSTDTDFSQVLAGPSSAHWLGTDEVGRDVLTRLFAAGGQTLLSSFVTVAVAIVIAVPLVLVAAEVGPRLERWISRGAEVILALPVTIILLAIVGTLGTHMYAVMALLGILLAAPMYRTLLGVAQSLHKRLYIDAARVDGASRVRVSRTYVLPGLASIMAVQGAQLFAVSILLQSGLAFMGFGPAAPTPSWGAMIQTASQYVYANPWLMVPTGAVLALTVIAANLVADAIAATLDPQAVTASLGRLAVPRPTAVVDGVSSTNTPTPVDPEALLQVVGLAVDAIDGPRLVSDVCLSLGEGEVLGLVGESGCGKTVTALSILGLAPGTVISSGTVTWRGRQLNGLPERELHALRGRDLAMIPQDPMMALVPVFTVGSQLTEPIRRLHKVGRREARRRALALLESVGIREPRDVMGSYPYQLSGGMAQRVVIAMAISGSPRLIVADEPTTALDVTTQAAILDLLRDLVARTGVSMILVSHDMGVVADICDRVAVMYAGEMVESGSVETVLERPQHPYTMALLAANPRVEDVVVPVRLPTIPGTVPAPGTWPAGCRFANRCQFVQPQCGEPIPLLARAEDVFARCIRAPERPAPRERPRSTEPTAQPEPPVHPEPPAHPEPTAVHPDGVRT